VVRQWGRIGQKGRVQMNGFATPEQAQQMFRRLHRQKLRRGYVER
jgi:predicted DNA-binding WGR domain protein